MSPPTAFLTPKEAAAIVGVLPVTLLRWAHEGHGPPVLRIGGRHRYPRAAFESWWAAMTSGAAQQRA
jgi:excisionase family DNA binding protein